MSGRLSILPVVGILLVEVGCSGLDNRPEPIDGSLRRERAAHQQVDRNRTATIRPARFDKRVEGSSEVPADSLPVPVNEPLARLGLQPHQTSHTFGLPSAPMEFTTVPAALNLDLPGALAMAAGQNPQIAFASARYREAYARLESAQTLWLPSIRVGASFNHHDGTLQASGGQVLNASRSSLQAGLGTRAIGAGSPAVPGVSAQFHTSDAVYQPAIAGHAAAAQNAAAVAVTNNTLLATALAYLELLGTTQQLRIAEDTRDNAENLAALTATFARTGQGPQADADRTQTELVRRRNAVSRAQENKQVATARLAELLSLDPSVGVMPLEATIVPIELVSPDLPPSELVATGLTNRPELSEAQSLVCEAVCRLRRERLAPLLPSVLLGISQSGFGGGFGSNIDNYRGRFDFDAAVFWELRNLGFGERAKRAETSSGYDQALALQAGMMDRVAREVVEAHTQVNARKDRIEVARSGVESATNSYERNLVRIREAQGLPIEMLQSLQALDEARHEYLRTLVDYNEAQFRLQRALGWPVL